MSYPRGPGGVSPHPGECVHQWYPFDADSDTMYWTCSNAGCTEEQHTRNPQPEARLEALQRILADYDEALAERTHGAVAADRLIKGVRFVLSSTYGFPS